MREPYEPGVRTLMKNGKWLIPEKDRPTLAPPPKEWSEAERRADKMIHPMNGLPVSTKANGRGSGAGVSNGSAE